MGQQVRKDDERIKASYETLPSPNGNAYIRGYLVRPFGADSRSETPKKLPGIIVIHENRGLNPHTVDVARRFALENFMAFAPDALSSVGGYPGDDYMGGQLFAKIDGAKRTQDFVAAALFDEIVEAAVSRAAETKLQVLADYHHVGFDHCLAAAEGHHRRRDEVFGPQIRCAHAHRGIDKVARLTFKPRDLDLAVRMEQGAQVVPLSEIAVNPETWRAERIPFARMLPSVIASIGQLEGNAGG